MRITRAQAFAAGLVLLAVLAVVIAAASGGGGGSGGASSGLAVKQGSAQLQPAAAGAPAGAQIDRLEQIVRSARQKP